jgi:hypothetical protein
MVSAQMASIRFPRLCLEWLLPADPPPENNRVIHNQSKLGFSMSFSFSPLGIIGICSILDLFSYYNPSSIQNPIFKM